MTVNGIDNNAEHLWTVGDPTAVYRAVKQFERLWSEAEEVGLPEIESMMATHEEYKTRRSSEYSDRLRNDAIAVYRSSQGAPPESQG